MLHLRARLGRVGHGRRIVLRAPAAHDDGDHDCGGGGGRGDADEGEDESARGNGEIA